MAVTFKLREAGTSPEKSINLVYDASTQADYQVYKGSQGLDAPVRPEFHVPDNAPPELIRLVPGLRTMFFAADIEGTQADFPSAGSDVDASLNNVAALARWIDGESQQAARYHLNGDCNRIELVIAPANATNVTVVPVVYGELFSITGYFDDIGEAGAMSHGARVVLLIAPIGLWDGSITLRNDLASSSHFIEDSDGDGLADGWIDFVNAPTKTIVTDRYLVGGQCQKIAVTAVAQTEGIRHNDVTAATSTQCVAFIWVHADSASDDILTIDLRDGANNAIDSVQFDPSGPAGHDKLRVDAAGNKWYRYVVSGTNVTAANFRFRVYRNSSDAVAVSAYYLDMAYLRTGTTTAPDAWSSTAAIENRYDPTSADEARINYVDIADIPGDESATLLLDDDFSDSILYYNMVWAMGTSGTQNINDAINPLNNDAFSLFAGSGTWTTTTADAGSHGGDYGDYVEFSTPSGATLRAVISNTDALSTRPYRVFVICRCNNTAATITLGATTDNAGIDPRVATIITADNYEVKDIGLLIPSADAIADSTGMTVKVDLDLGGMVASDEFRIAAVFLLPASPGFAIGLQYPNHTNIYIDGARESIYTSHASVESAGDMWTVPAGLQMTRIYSLMYDQAGHDYLPDDTHTLTLTITPRTRHMFGTV